MGPDPSFGPGKLIMVVVGFVQSIVTIFYYLWRGRLGLPFTYWVVGIGGNISVFVFPLIFINGLGAQLNTAHVVHLLISAAYFGFSTICVVRAAGKTGRPKTWPF